MHARDCANRLEIPRKFALLPFLSKFGVPEVYKISQAPSGFEERHLNVPIMAVICELTLKAPEDGFCRGKQSKRFFKCQGD